MRVSKQTKEIVDNARNEAHQIKAKILDQLKRLDELPGVGKHAKVLQKAIKPLDEFITGN
jgi:hypothetical protein